ncbi:DUF4942 domain-containing protein [Enterobacter hormaechei]|nr:DUF4942 domain-containing protein [Enterobacter hormaechei]
MTVKRGKGSLKKQVWTGTGTISKKKPLTNPFVRIRPSLPSEIVKGTLQHALANRRDTLAEGFVDVLNKLDRSFKKQCRAIYNAKKACSSGDFFLGVNVLRYNGFSQDNHFCLRDFENIVCICSDTPTPATGGGLSMVDRLTAMRNTEFTGEVSDENGWRCRLFENGNVHICIDSISLLNALNDLISIYFANQLPAAGKK